MLIDFNNFKELCPYNIKNVKTKDKSIKCYHLQNPTKNCDPENCHLRVETIYKVLKKNETEIEQNKSLEMQLPFPPSVKKKIKAISEEIAEELENE